MLDLPKNTVFNRRIPKQKFYENLSVAAELKRLFAEQINAIYWRNKIAPSTVNIAPGKTVEEIEVIEIRLNQPNLDKRVLQLIDRGIPYHILFLLVFAEQVQAWIAYKEKSEGGTVVFKPVTYYHTEWQPTNELSLRLDGINMDAAYESFIRQIAEERLEDKTGGNLKDAIARDELRQKLLKEIAALENKVRREKQFNRQVELNGELKRLRKELEGLR
jgi:DNA-binding XRE family transcriptional regulator